MQFTISSLTGPSALESLPNELLLRIMSHAILAPSITSDLSLASSASDPSIDQINSDLLSAPRVSISPSFGQRAPPHGLTDIQALCVTSRRLHEFAGTMLYRCAVLETEKSGLLFRAEGKRVGRRGEDDGEERRCPSQSYTDPRNAVKPRETDYHHIRTSNLPRPWVLPPTKEGRDKSDSPDDCLYPIGLHERWYCCDRSRLGCMSQRHRSTGACVVP
jgi:hypothetical protein